MKVNDIITESQHSCPHCGGPVVEYSELMEKKDACYYKVKAGAKVWPSAYASGRLVQCRKKGASNYGNKSESIAEGKITLSTDPNWYGATVDNYQASGPVVNIPANQLVGFEPDDKMNQPKSKVNVEKIVAGLKQGAKLPPLLVRKYKNGYQVLDGHHRFWAYKLLGVKSIPAQIVPDSDIEEISKQGVAEDSDNKCPPATQDITLNLKNRQKAIDDYGYGPLNPDMPNTKFWMKKVDEWNLDSAEEAKQSLCGNCAAFDIREETLDCIAQGIDSDSPADAAGVIDAGDLGYCKFLKFKCASRRTCDAWVTGGPLRDKPNAEEGLTEEFDLIESIIEGIAEQNGVDAEAVWADLESLTEDELYVFAVTSQLNEDWQKANKRDRTAGMSQKAVNAYRRENPGSKLKTAVTTKPSKLKRGSKASKRRKSYCSRSRGQMKMHNISCAKTPDKAICKARRRWNC